MKLLNDNVLIEIVKKEEKSDTGIILAGKQKSYLAAVDGKVLEIGTEVKHIAIGDSVLLAPNTGFEVENTDPQQKIVKSEDILAIL